MKKPSLRKAINAKCMECICDSGAPGTWRQQVERCTATGCPLYQLRPVSKPPKRQSLPREVNSAVR